MNNVKVENLIYAQKVTGAEKDGQRVDTSCIYDITHITPSANGKLWITTYWKGVELFDPETGRFVHFDKDRVQGDCMKQTIQDNYNQIKEDVKQIVKDELGRIANDENLKHLIQK